MIVNAPSPTFTSGSAAIAEVDNTGAVLGLNAGTTTINVSLSMGSITKTASVPLNVTGVLSSDADVVASSGDYLFTPKVVAIQAGEIDGSGENPRPASVIPSPEMAFTVVKVQPVKSRPRPVRCANPEWGRKR